MKKLLLSGLALAASLATAPDLYAHGGQYRGPGDVVPPNPGGGRGSGPGSSGPNTPGPSAPNTPGPAGPSTPGPSGPSTGGPAPSSGPGAAATGPRGAQVGDDLTRWAFWWEFNKDPFIRLKDAIHAGGVTTGTDDFYLGGARREDAVDTLKPTKTDILNQILPALKQALESTTDRDITSSCIVAMAKIGEDHPNFKVLPLFEQRLKERDQEIRETAALAMGISQLPDALPTLIHLVKDTQQGRSLVDRGEVDVRTRTFAAYGIGLVAWASSNTDLKRSAFDALKEVLGATRDRNLKIGVINGIRLIRTNPEAGEKEQKLRDEMLDTLWTYYQKQEGQGEQQIQAHVPSAIASILGRGGDVKGTYKDRFAGELEEKFGKRNNNIYQSAALALGQLCTTGKEDQKYCKLLEEYSGKGRDQQARYFATMALGMIGGNDNRNALLKQLNKGSDQEKSWAAISLGVLAHNTMKAAGKGATTDATIGRELQNLLNNDKNEEVQSACAIALGLCKYTEAADDLRKLLEKYKKRDDFAGYLSLGLALMNDTGSKELIRNIVKDSIRRPELLKYTAIALGKMGDRDVAQDLTDLLAAPDKNVAKLSAIASALGYIGDRRSIDPLKKMLFDQSITELSRAFAAVALGGIADKEDLPWNSKIAVDINYRAAVETLTNQQTGILDIL
ncbi:MAG TPA: HEAT repeat domain-containing protein [Planctomycetota bacterium]|nr:HEAT repeat domain-containing protein [Planctomycetota bacterium]